MGLSFSSLHPTFIRTRTEERSIFIQLIFPVCTTGVLHLPRLMCTLHTMQLLRSVAVTGLDCCVLVADMNRDTFHMLLDLMQLHQSSKTLTWHPTSGLGCGLLVAGAGKREHGSGNATSVDSEEGFDRLPGSVPTIQKWSSKVTCFSRPS